MARKYVQVSHQSRLGPDSGPFQITVSTGYGGPVHLVVSGDDEELVDRFMDRMAQLLKEEGLVGATK